MKHKKILITGGSGYLGSAIAEYLLCSGHQVTLGIRDAERFKPWVENYRTLELQLDQRSVLDKIPDEFDTIIHTAALDSNASELNPGRAFEINTFGTEKLARWALTRKVSHIIYLSTVHVYEKPLKGRITENYPATNVHPYAASHLEAEKVLNRICAGKIQLTVLRISNIYGPPVHPKVNCWSLFINNICRSAIKRGIIEIRNNSFVRRDFFPLSEFVIIIGKLLTHVNANIKNGVYNVGSGRSFTLSDIALTVKKIADESFAVSVEIHQFSRGVIEPNFFFCQEKIRSLHHAQEDLSVAEIKKLLLYHG